MVELNSANGGDESFDAEEASGLVLHVRSGEKEEDIPLEALHVNPSLSDELIREKVEQHLNLPDGELHHSQIERHVDGNMSIFC